MLYTEIEMSTPTKISARNPVCKLCGGSYESPYMLRMFSKAGLSQNLYSKLHKISGITISEDDTTWYEDNSVNLKWRYIRRQNGSVYSESSICRQHAVWSINSEYSVKRCFQLNFHRLRMSRRSVYQRICQPKASMWMSRNKRGW